MNIEILPPDEDRQVERLSSIDQYRHTLCVMQQGGWTPISFDSLDYIDCDTVRTHPIIITDDPQFIGYHYKIGECKYFTDEYIHVDHYGKELRKLPHWFGEGFHETFINSSSFINFDEGSLGTRNEGSLKVGLDYYLAKETLNGV